MVARIDRVSGAVLKAGPFPGALRIAVGFGSVWVGAGNLYLPTPDPQAVDLVRLDADSLTVRARLSLPQEKVQYPLVVEPVAGTIGLWVAYGAHIYELDPLTDSISRSWSMNGVVSSIALSPNGERLYVGAQTSSDPWATISSWDTTTMNRLASVSTGGGGLGGPEVVAGSDKVWVAYATGMMGQIEERRTSDLADLHARTPAFSNSIRVQVAGGFVWFTDGMAERLGCLDPQTGAVLSTTEHVQSDVVAGDNSGLFVGDLNGVAGLIPAARCRSEAG
jgi:DNA-binding beta-propeller fold protein YncE